MFTSARVQLTGWYLLIIMTISLAFSAVIYGFLSREVDRFVQIQSSRLETRLLDCTPTATQPCVTPFNIVIPLDNTELIRETKKRVVNSLLFINGSIFVVAGGLGYFLAGRTLQPIKDMVEEQNRFISDASHELKTPLTSLKTAFEVHMRNKKRTLKESDQLVEESIEEVNKLQQLSESLLLLAGYRRPLQSYQLEPITVATVINKAVKRVQPLAKKKKIKISTSITDAVVLGNPHAVTDLLVILLDNAIKYSDNHSKIELSTSLSKNNITVSVTDHGKGIAAADLEHIYERFYRSDSARSKSETAGYGLGLSIAQHIASANKASLEVKSTLGHGSVFSLKLGLYKQTTKKTPGKSQPTS